MLAPWGPHPGNGKRFFVICKKSRNRKGLVAVWGTPPASSQALFAIWDRHPGSVDSLFSIWGIRLECSEGFISLLANSSWKRRSLVCQMCSASRKRQRFLCHFGTHPRSGETFWPHAERIQEAASRIGNASLEQHGLTARLRTHAGSGKRLVATGEGIP